MRRLVLAAALAAFAFPAAAQDLCAERSIRFIVPFPPGGSVDTVARLFAPHVGQATGRQIVVDNRGGASGSVGTAMAAAAPGDGCTVLLVFDTHAVNPSLIPRLPFDTERDLAPLMLLGTSPMVLAAHPSSGITLTGAECTAQLPDTPTFRELGFAGFAAYAWWGILMPGRTPSPMVARMHAEFARVIALPEVRIRLEGLGMDVVASDPDRLRGFIAAEIPRWREVIRANSITAGD